jgi:hypothetical protein
MSESTECAAARNQGGETCVRAELRSGSRIVHKLAIS